MGRRRLILFVLSCTAVLGVASHRLAKAERAWRDENGDLQTGSAVATMKYDGLGRRVAKAVANSADASRREEKRSYPDCIGTAIAAEPPLHMEHNRWLSRISFVERLGAPWPELQRRRPGQSHGMDFRAACASQRPREVAYEYTSRADAVGTRGKRPTASHGPVAARQAPGHFPLTSTQTTLPSLVRQ
jgi:hypothetical protein